MLHWVSCSGVLSPSSDLYLYQQLYAATVLILPTTKIHIPQKHKSYPMLVGYTATLLVGLSPGQVSVWNPLMRSRPKEGLFDSFGEHLLSLLFFQFILNANTLKSGVESITSAHQHPLILFWVILPSPLIAGEATWLILVNRTWAERTCVFVAEAGKSSHLRSVSQFSGATIRKHTNWVV